MIPMYLMYEISIWTVKIFGRRKPAMVETTPE
jgi:Sec-independent protein secretion pathway component TatC